MFSEATIHAERGGRMRDLELLDALLYDTIVEQEGAAFAAAYREMTESPALLDGASREDAARLIRALTLRFRLSSLAEERGRAIEIAQAAQTAASGGVSAIQAGSFAEAVRAAAAAGATADEIRTSVAGLRFHPVLTAHPTEARRRTLIALLGRMRVLLDRRSAAIDPAEAALCVRRLREEVTNLWRMGSIRTRSVTPLDEVRSAMVHFDETIFRLAPRLLRGVDEALQQLDPTEGESGSRPPHQMPTIRWGSWIGGDRDGNPNVTAEVAFGTGGKGTQHHEICFQNQGPGMKITAAKPGIGGKSEQVGVTVFPGDPENRAGGTRSKYRQPPTSAANQRRAGGAQSDRGTQPDLGS